MWTAASVSFAVRDAHLLRGVDVEVRPGAFLAVLGPNGAGKSTLFRLLTGELGPTRGEVLLDGKPLPAWPARHLATRYAAMPQQTDIPFPLTVEEVVMLGRLPYFNWREKERDRAVVRQALAKVDLNHFGSRLYPTLSGGEKQRVQFARALAQLGGPEEAEGKYLFLDEPVSSLDLRHQHELFHLVRNLARQGTGVFAVLHDLNLAAMYADRVLLLTEGRMMGCGTPAELFTEDRLREVLGRRVVVLRHPHRDCPLVVPV